MPRTLTLAIAVGNDLGANIAAFARHLAAERKSHTTLNDVSDPTASPEWHRPKRSVA